MKYAKGATKKFLPSAPEELRRREQGRVAARMRIEGHNNDEIAEATGIKSAADVTRVINTWLEKYPREDADNFRTLLTARLEQSLVRCEAIIALSNASGHLVLKAVEQKSLIVAQLAKLHGVNKPEQVHVTHSGEIEERMREMTRQMKIRADKQVEHAEKRRLRVINGESG